MAVDPNRLKENALAKLQASGKFDRNNEILVILVTAVCEAWCEEVPSIEDIGGTPTSPPATSHK